MENSRMWNNNTGFKVVRAKRNQRTLHALFALLLAANSVLQQAQYSFGV